MRNPFKKRPHILKLYKWNKTLTEAHCSSKDFDRTFAGYNAVHDLDTGKIFAPFHIGEKTVMVVRDSEQKK